MGRQKQRIGYEEFLKLKAARETIGSVAYLIDKFVNEMDGTPLKAGIRPLGESHRCILRCIERSLLGPLLAVAVRRQHIMEYARELKATRAASTVMQYITYLTNVFKYAGSAWDECDGLTAAHIDVAKPFLAKTGVIGKGAARHQRPTDEQMVTLLAYFAKQNEHSATKVDMALMLRWQNASARRVGESCALLWRDWSPDDQTVFVRKMKDPKRRDKAKIVALPRQAQEMLLELAYEMNADPAKRNDEPRIFPFSKKTCSQRHTKAKKLFGFDLRLHDQRRERGSRLVEDDGYSAEEAIQFTGHDSPAVFTKVYMKLDASKVATRGPSSRRVDETAR